MSIDIGDFPKKCSSCGQSFLDWAIERCGKAETERQARSREQRKSHRREKSGRSIDAFEFACREKRRHGTRRSYQPSFVTLPGYFRPTKQWDLVVTKNGRLIAVVELKSICGPSFGNNANNRTEEALGSGIDLQTAIREGAFGKGKPPFTGFVILIEEAEDSIRPVGLSSKHFPTDPAFVGASYVKRLDLLCDRMMREGLYTAAAVIASPDGNSGAFRDESPETGIKRFLAAFPSRMAEESCI